MQKISVILSYVIILLISMIVFVRGDTWETITPASTEKPSARYDTMLMYLNGHLYLFGGRETGTIGKNDLWKYTISTKKWEQITPSSDQKPPKRYSSVVGVDHENNMLYVTAGQDGTTFFHDVWAFNVTANVWMDKSPSTGEKPVSRYGTAGGTYYKTGRHLYITHGFTSESERFDDTWRYGFDTKEWENISPASTGAKPQRRCLHGAAMLTKEDMVLFGGTPGGLKDTWHYAQATKKWEELKSKPGTKNFVSMTAIHEPTNDNIVGAILQGGHENGGEIWYYSCKGTWERRIENTNYNVKASGIAFVPKQTDNDPFVSVYVFGGRNNSNGNARDVLGQYRMTAVECPENLVYLPLNDDSKSSASTLTGSLILLLVHFAMLLIM